MSAAPAWRLGDIVWPTSIKLPVEPTHRQALALSMDWKREALFGGAAGGGKSVYLLLAALQLVDFKEYRALILRRTFPQLKIALGLLELANEWLSGQAIGAESRDGYPTRWVFPSGAQLNFGHCQHLKDRESYQGGGWHYTGFDELTQFLEAQYVYIAFSRQRRTVVSKLPIRVRATSNPGGSGHEWVRQRFKVNADEIGPEDTAAFVTPGRAFVPSKIRDNPHLDADDYEKSLMQLHPYERAMLMEGNWDVRPPGALFRREWFQLFDFIPGKVRRRVRYWDLAATEAKPGRDPDWTVGTLMAKLTDAPVDYLVEDVERFQLEPGPLELRLRAVVESDPPGTLQVIEHEPGSAGKIAARALGRALEGYRVRFERPTGSKPVRAGPYASAASQGRVGCLRGVWLTDHLRELEQFSGVDDAHDDQVDSADGAYAELALAPGVSWDDLYPQSGADSEPENQAGNDR